MNFLERHVRLNYIFGFQRARLNDLTTAFWQRGPKSWTRLMLSKFSEAFLATHPSHRVVTREVQSIPHLDYDAIEAGRTDQTLHTPEQQRAFALANELTDELVNADAIIISTPMYNWSLPSALKAWIDRVINCRTFYQRTDTVAKIPVTFIVISGATAVQPTTGTLSHFSVCLTLCRRPVSLGSKNDAR